MHIIVYLWLSMCAAFEEFIVNHFANNQVIIHTLNEEMLLAEIKDQ